MTRARRIYLLSLLAFLVALLAAAVLLPERVAVHFSFTGQPDRETSRGEALNELMVLGVLMAALFWTVARWSDRMPLRMFNVPHREYWTAEEHETELREMVREDLYTTGALVMGLLTVVVVLTTVVARQDDPRLGSLQWVVMSVFVLAVLAHLVHLVLVRYRPPDHV